MNDATEAVIDAINNDEGLYNLAKISHDFDHFIDLVGQDAVTPWGSDVKYSSNLIDHDEVNELIDEVKGE